MANLLKAALVPLEPTITSLTGGAGRRSSFDPQETAGAPGTPIYSGYVVENEKDPALTGRQKYITYSQALANTSVVAAGVRYFLNLAANAEWTFEPADDPRGEELAELAEQMLTEDPATSWPRIVRRAAMYRFYGFSLQEWTAMRREDGLLSMQDIAPRAQLTIDRWDVATTGAVLGVFQRNPQDSKELYLPRGKLVYMVDDTLNDSPEGLGLFRHIVRSVKRLERYEQLEGFGFETDLRGVPIGRLPYSELNERIKNGEITPQQAAAATSPIESFIKKHIKNPALGLTLDSDVFASTDEATRPSSTRKFDISLLEGSQTSLPDIAAAIERTNSEIARVLGIESLLLGGGEGSYALSKDKSSQFSLTVDATLSELADTFQNDLLGPLWDLNGWPDEAKPKLKVEAASYRDIDQVTAAIRDMAQAGDVLMPGDPIINHVRALLGAPLKEDEEGMIDAALMGGDEDDVDDGETIENDTGAAPDET